jgi:hypothetical protein
MAAPISAPAPVRPVIQRKTRVGPVDDPLESEADRIADAVVSGGEIGAVTTVPAAPVRRKCARCEEEETKTLRRKATATLSSETISPHEAEAAATAVTHGGLPLTPEQRGYFEPRFGRSFADVRIHTGEAAARASLAIGARAFASGSAIAFAPGEFRPQTGAGARLLAHELTHVAQQGHSSERPIRRAVLRIGSVTIEIDYGSLIRIAMADWPAEIAARIGSWTGAPPSAATQSSIAALGAREQEWVLFGLHLLIANTTTAHSRLNRVNAVNRLIARAPMSSTRALGTASTAFEREVMTVSGWLEVALTSAMTAPTGVAATRINEIVNPPPTSGSTGDPLDAVALRSRLVPALGALLTAADPASWPTRGARSLSAFQAIGDVVLAEARDFFRPFADTARDSVFFLNPPWRASANIFDVGTLVPDTAMRISYLLNRAQIVGRNDTVSPPAMIDANIFADTHFDGTRPTDRAELSSILSDMEADPAISARVDRLIRITGRQSGRGAATRIGIATSFNATSFTACRDHWRGIATMCHEVLHALVHPDFFAASTRIGFPQVVREGFTEVLGNQLFNQRVRPKAASNATFKAAVETSLSSGTPCPAPAAGTIGYGAAGSGAEDIRSRVGDNRFRAAYFLGRPDLAGIP